MSIKRTKQGYDGMSVKDVTINSDGHLIITLELRTDSIVGSTMTTSTVIAPKHESHQTVTEQFTLSGTTVVGITHDPSKEDHDLLITALALRRSFEPLQSYLDRMEYLVSKFSNPDVISDPLCDPHFLDKHWGSENTSFDNGKVIITKRTQKVPFAYLLINSSAFTSSGWYYVEVHVTELTPGSKMIIRTETDTVLKEITVKGIYKFRYEVPRPSTALLYFEVTELPDDGNIVLDKVYLHSVKHSLDRYMKYIQEYEAGSSGFVDFDQLADALVTNLNEANSYAKSLMLQLGELLDSHRDDATNPHGTQYHQTGAAPLVHQHTPDECGAAAKKHTHLIEDLASPNMEFESILDHLNDTDNKYHKVTKHQVELGNLPNATTDVPVNSSETLATGKALYNVHSRLVEHANNYNNPHLIEKDDIGLGEVDNFPTATLAEHVDGVREDAFTTPQGTKYAVEAWTNSGVDITKMQPRALYHFKLDSSSDESVTIPILDNKIYQLKVSFPLDISQEVNVKDFHMSFMSSGTPVKQTSSWMYVGGTESSVIWKTEKDNTFFSPVPSGYGSSVGQWDMTLDTNSFELRGSYLSHLMTTVDDEVTVDSMVRPCQIFSSVSEEENVKQYIDTLSFVNGTNAPATIIVYELMPVFAHPTVIVDATPVGHMSSALKLTPVQAGWSYIDGSILSKVKHSKLWDYARTAGLVIDEDDWDVLNDSGEDIPHFCDMDEDTFRIPKIQDLDQPWILNIIKIKDVTIPKDVQVLFRLIMDEEEEI